MVGVQGSYGREVAVMGEAGGEGGVHGDLNFFVLIVFSSLKMLCGCMIWFFLWSVD